MADTCYDRYWEVGHIFGQSQGVETAHIAGSTTTTDNHYAIKWHIVNLLQSTDDALFNALALHDSRKELCLEFKAVRVISQLVAEIAVASGCLR